MIKLDQLPTIPTHRVKAADGMAVTAEVWDDAHEYHHEYQKLHALFNHGAGIGVGLDVIASDPPDNSVYILPGIATDGQGNTIVVKEPLSYDLGRTSDGVLHILLTYGESRPRPKAGRDEDGAALYAQAEFGVEATFTPPAGPHVEIARILRERAVPIVNPADPTQPKANEIDQRYRRETGAAWAEADTIGVAYLGGNGDGRHGRGAAQLAHALRGPWGGHQRVWLDDAVPLDAELKRYTLLYLAGHGPFQLAPDQMTSIYNYLKQGGTVLFELCRRDPNASVKAATAFNEMLGSFGLALGAVPTGHALLHEPHFFPALPGGYDPEGASELRLAEGVVVCTADYGCLWAGERRGRAAAREELRSAYEWGHNVLAYARARRAATQTS